MSRGLKSLTIGVRYVEWVCYVNGLVYVDDCIVLVLSTEVNRCSFIWLSS